MSSKMYKIVDKQTISLQHQDKKRFNAFYQLLAHVLMCGFVISVNLFNFALWQQKQTY